MNLWKQHLGHVPATVWEDPDIETLVLADNDLTGIPPELGRLKRLGMLDLGHNQLTRIPAEIGDLKRLTDFLYLNDNQLADLPDSLARLTRLPPAIGRFSELRQLDLRGNPLAELPEEITRLPKLEKLDLRWVETLGLPAWIADLEARGCAVYR